VVAEGLELGNEPTDSHPSWRPPAMAVLSAITRSPLCEPALLQVAPDRQGSSNALLLPSLQAWDTTPCLAGKVCQQSIAGKAV
jgi:hypothetical protein